MRTTESHWDAEPLRGTECHIGAHLAGRSDQRQREQVGAEGDQGAALMCLLGEFGPVADPAAGSRRLSYHPEELPLG